MQRSTTGGSTSDSNSELLSRIVERRIRECRSLNDERAQNRIIQGIHGASEDLMNRPADHFEHLLKHHFQTATSPTASCQDRRESWDALRTMLARVDQQLVIRRAQQRAAEGVSSSRRSASSRSSSTDNAASATAQDSAHQPPIHPAMAAHPSATTQQTSPPSYQRHSSTTLARAAEKASRRHGAPVHPALAQNNNNKNGHHHTAAAAPVQPSMQTTQQQQPQHPAMTLPHETQQQHYQYQQQQTHYQQHPQYQQPQQHQMVVDDPIPYAQTPNPLVHQNSATYAQAMPTSFSLQNGVAHPRRSSPVNYQPVTATPAAQNGVRRSSETTTSTRRPSQTSTAAFDPPASKAVSSSNNNNEIMKMTTATKPTEVRFNYDPPNSRYSSALRERPLTVVQFRRQHPSKAMSLHIGSRFGKWEPFWDIVEVFALGVTSPVTKSVVAGQNGKVASITKTAGAAKIENGFPKNFVNYWGKDPPDGQPKPGDRRLYVRMLPLKRDAKYEKKRADCHIWPKGTYLTLNGKPAELKQRKQQNHDEKEWKGSSLPLDLARLLPNPEKSLTIGIGCYDSQQYVFCVALCEYVPAPTLMEKVLMPNSQILDRLTLEQSKAKAKGMAQQQALSIDVDGDDTDTNNKTSQQELGKFVFSVFCPIKKMEMVAPVRGKHCKHFQCFDLEYFLLCQLSVGEGRWRCASPACDQFVSYQDLQYCSLTEAAITKFSKELSPLRNRVEFCEDGSYRLLPPQKLRYGNKKRKRMSGDNSGNNNGGKKQELSSSRQQEIEEIVID